LQRSRLAAANERTVTCDGLHQEHEEDDKRLRLGHRERGSDTESREHPVRNTNRWGSWHSTRTEPHMCNVHPGEKQETQAGAHEPYGISSPSIAAKWRYGDVDDCKRAQNEARAPVHTPPCMETRILYPFELFSGIWLQCGHGLSP
jgi:hypothetical protein